MTEVAADSSRTNAQAASASSEASAAPGQATAHPSTPGQGIDQGPTQPPGQAHPAGPVTERVPTPPPPPTPMGAAPDPADSQDQLAGRRGAHAAPAASDLGGEAVVKGRIDIADEVVEKVAGLAAREVPGVHTLGGDVSRALDALRERMGKGEKGGQGVRVEMNERRVSVAVTVVVEYGHVVIDVANAVKANVARAVGRMLGLHVVEVNVVVDDVRLPEEEAETETEAAEGF